MKVGWYPISKAATKTAESKQLPEDIFNGEYSTQGLVEFQDGVTPAILKEAAKQSTIIPQCIEAYSKNITGYGVALEYKSNENDQTAAGEWERAERFLTTTSLDKPLETLLQELIFDLESCGNAYIEVAFDGEFPAIYRIRPEYVRCTPEKDRIEVKHQRLIKSNVETFTQLLYARRYAQKHNYSIAWFEPFGSTTENNQIIHLAIGDKNPYGEPRWIGHAPGVAGSRKAEELNLNYFENGRMLSMILTAINGGLTEESLATIASLKGAESQGGILYLEVVSDDDEDGYNPNASKKKTEIKLDKLNDLLQTDALFLNYTSEKEDGILSSFRLPPILVGRSDDYSRATADAALGFAEEQIFQPYRKWLMDEIFNYRLFPAFGIHRVKAILRSPKIVDPEERKSTLELLSANGILLVKHLMPIAEEVLGIVIEEKDYPNGYLDTPISQLNIGQLDSLPVPIQKMISEDDKIAKIKDYLHRKKVQEHV